MRARNPCVFARLRFFGCQVRFMIEVGARRASASIERGPPAPARSGRPEAAADARSGFSRDLRRGPKAAPKAVAMVGRVAPTGPIENDPAAIWQRVRSEVQASLPAATFDLWLEPLRVIGGSAGTLYLAAPARVRTWVERRYLDQLEAVLRGLETGFERIVLVEPERAREPERRSARAVAEPLPIDPAHTFDRFVIGPGSRFAHAAALAVAELPGEAYNPLFLHGPPGLGKTHLLGAIAGYYRDHHPALTFHLTTAERFTSEFVAALRTDGPERFKERYRALDGLLIDDVQVLEGKPRTEEEFVHTFNALYAAGKQIVLSSDRPPGSLERLEQRLRDRFEWGLTVEVEPPDLRTRIALLWRFAGDAVDQLPEPDVLRAIATRVPGNVRRLEGALTRVLAVSSIFDEPLGGPSLARALPPAEAAAVADAPSITAIQEAVSSVLGVPREAMLSKQRTPRVTRARQLAMFLARDLTPLSLAQIAREFDRDHSTVLHALRVVEGRNEPGSEVAGDIHSVRVALGKLEASPRPDDDPSHPASENPQP
jgi:chromosomal replication initiator protein